MFQIVVYIKRVASERDKIMTTTTELAQKIAAFIEHNDIDVTQTPMDEIVKGYFAANLSSLDTAAEQVKQELVAPAKTIGCCLSLEELATERVKNFQEVSRSSFQADGVTRQRITIKSTRGKKQHHVIGYEDGSFSWAY